MAVASKGREAKVEIPAPSKFFLDLVGSTAVAASLSAVAPIARVKLLLQVQYASATITADMRYKGIIDALVRVPKEQGFAALWRGNFTNIVRYFPSQALNFVFSDVYKKVFVYDGPNSKEHRGLVFRGHLAAGGAAGATALFFVYPLDFARTRLAADVGRAGNREFRGLADCLIKTVKSDGPTGLYRGLLISLQGVVIYRAAYFGMFNTANQLIGLDKKRNLPATMGLATLTTLGSAMIAYPWDTVRRRMMMGPEVRFGFPWDTFRRTDFKITLDQFMRTMIKNEGWHALYKGALANVLARATGGAFALAIYDHVQKFI